MTYRVAYRISMASLVLCLLLIVGLLLLKRTGVVEIDGRGSSVGRYTSESAAYRLESCKRREF